jgi:hypothetical protein
METSAASLLLDVRAGVSIVMADMTSPLIRLTPSLVAAERIAVRLLEKR